ncbi:MAG TPA: GNAT family N-acetyltransferase [Steroidobacteraceae bacterium]
MSPGIQTEDVGGVAQAPHAGDSGAEWPQHSRTRDGAEYRIRPIQSDDLERERAFIHNRSDSSRYIRMMVLLREPSEEMLDRLVHVEYRRDMALVAIVGEGADEEIIAVARYGGNAAYCEFAIAVAEAWQSRGVGTTLSKRLFEYARLHRVRRLCALFPPANVAMLRLTDTLGMTIRKSLEDVSEVEAWRIL